MYDPPFKGKEVTPWRSRAWNSKKPHGPGRNSGLKIGRRARIERIHQLDAVIGQALAIFSAKGRKAAIEYVASWREWLKEYYRAIDLDCSGTLLDRWLEAAKHNKRNK